MISVESLDMKAMSGSLRLGKATLDNGYGMFCSMLAYKQAREGHILVRVEKHFPSSQLCSCCGYKNPGHEEAFHPEDPLPEMRHGI